MNAKVGEEADTLSTDARRNILVAAWEEDAVFEVFRNLKGELGGNDAQWLAAIRREAACGYLEAYRYSPGPSGFDLVDLTKLEPTDIGTNHNDAVYLVRTDATMAAIQSLPPPPVGDTRWVIGLWCDQ